MIRATRAPLAVHVFDAGEVEPSGGGDPVDAVICGGALVSPPPVEL